MKKQRYLITNIVLGVLALVVFLAGATSASAATSANATIHNVVGVEWFSGATVYHQAASVDVTVATVASLPTIFQNPANRTVANLTAVDYHTVITSNANGPDTYTFAPQAEILDNIATGSGYAYPVASQQLWGGIIVGSNTTGNTIYLPGGSIVTGTPADSRNVDTGMFVVINGNLYTVNAVVSVGAAAAGATAGATPTPATPEVLAQVTLTAAPAQWGFGAGIALSGTYNGSGAPSGLIGVQVGQAVDVDNFSFTTANPTNPALTATYTNPFTVTTAAGDLAGAVLTTPAFNFVTTVQMATLTINKYYRVIAGGSAGTPTPSVDVTSAATIAATFPSAGSPKPGEYVEYCIVVHNTGLGDATANVIKDPLPPYTTYQASTTYSNTDHAVGSVPLSAVGDVAGSSVVQTIGGYAFTPISAGNYAVIVYQLKVN